MVLTPEQERVRTLLKDTITLLCRNGLPFKSKFSIEAVIGVTLDEEDIFLVSMNEIVNADGIEPKSDLIRAANTNPVPLQCSKTTAPSDKRKNQRCNNNKRKRQNTVNKWRRIGTTDNACADKDVGTKRFKNMSQAYNSPDGLLSGSERLSNNEDLLTNKDYKSDDCPEDFLTNKDYKHEFGADDNDDDEDDSAQIKEEPAEAGSGLTGTWTNENLRPCHTSTPPRTPPPEDSLHDISFGADGNLSLLPGLSDVDNPDWLPGSLSPLSHSMKPARSQQTTSTAPDGNKHDKLEETSPQEITDMLTHMSPTKVPSSFSDPEQTSYSCAVCGKTFSRRYSWKMHMNLHEGKYNIYCHICNKGFNNSYTLKGHMSNVHTGIKEFKCSLCGKEFGYEHHFKSHYLRSHRGVEMPDPAFSKSPRGCVADSIVDARRGATNASSGAEDLLRFPTNSISCLNLPSQRPSRKLATSPGKPRDDPMSYSDSDQDN